MDVSMHAAMLMMHVLELKYMQYYSSHLHVDLVRCISALLIYSLRSKLLRHHVSYVFKELVKHIQHYLSYLYMDLLRCISALLIYSLRLNLLRCHVSYIFEELAKYVDILLIIWVVSVHFSYYMMHILDAVENYACTF